MSRNSPDPDLWGHVQYGRDAWAEGLAFTNTYSYTAPGFRWVNHENIAELAMAWAVQHWGPSGILLAKCAMGVFVLWMMMRVVGRQVRATLFTYGATLLVAVNLMLFWNLRPHVFSYFYLGLMLPGLAWCFPSRIVRSMDIASSSGPHSLVGRTGRWRVQWLWLAAPFFAVWANTHGAFVAGYGIFVCYLAGKAVEAWWFEGRQATGVGLWLAAIGIAAGAATLCNPYGIGLHRWLLGSLGAPRPEITEWLPPELGNVAFLPFWILAATFVGAMLLTNRPRDWTQCVILALVFYESLRHQRHIPLFTLMFGFWMPVHVQSAFERMRGWCRASESRVAPGESPVWFQYGFVVVLVAVNVWIIGLVAQNLREIPVRHTWYPVAAFQHIHDRGYRGRMVVPFRWAQYAIMAFGADESTGVRALRPRLTVAFDGRFRTCYPQEVVDMCFDFEMADDDANRHRSAASRGAARDRILDVGRPTLALIDRANPTAMRRIRERDDWRLVYEDATAELWLRGKAAAGEEIVARGEFAETDRVAWPALPRSGPDVRQVDHRE